MRRYALFVPVFLSLLSVTQARELGPEEREALARGLNVRTRRARSI